MKSREVIRDIMKNDGISNATLAHRLNMTLAATWELASKEKNAYDMRVNKLCMVLNALDYKLVAVPRDAKIPSGAYVIE